MISWSRHVIRYYQYILLMEEILHQLQCSLSHYLNVFFLQPRWFSRRISEPINSINAIGIIRINKIHVSHGSEYTVMQDWFQVDPMRYWRRMPSDMYQSGALLSWATGWHLEGLLGRALYYSWWCITVIYIKLNLCFLYIIVHFSKRRRGFWDGWLDDSSVLSVATSPGVWLRNMSVAWGTNGFFPCPIENAVFQHIRKHDITRECMFSFSFNLNVWFVAFVSGLCLVISLLPPCVCVCVHVRTLATLLASSFECLHLRSLRMYVFFLQRMCFFKCMSRNV